MTIDIQRIDLHVHSKYAGRFKLFVLNSLEVEECYTEPQTLYDTMMARGMTMVTITDHDAIQGCLEIAHHGDHVFISEEVSARFPENGCIVHVLVFGITEAQHEECQRLRYNIYELRQYLRNERILHCLAHPFSPVNQRLTPDLLRKSLVLFDTLEAINGQKDPGHERFVREVLRKVDHGVLAQWAERYSIELEPNRRWKITGGSDDHSGVTMARAYTEFRGPPTFDGLRAAIRAGEVEVAGFEKTCKSYAHTAYLGTVNYMRNSSKQQSQQTIIQLLNLVEKKELPDDLESCTPVMQRILPAAMQTLAEAERLPSAKLVRETGHRPELHDEIYKLIQTALLRAFRASTDQVQEAMRTMDPEPLIDELPTLIRLSLFNMPYYFGIRFFYGERRRARALYDSLELPEPLHSRKRVAVLCDTLDNVDGLSINLRRLVAEMRSDGNEVFLCGAKHDGFEPSTDDDGIVRFPCIASFPLLGYESYTLGWPSMLEVVRWMDENEIDLVVATTPGPVCLVGMLAARLLDTPIVGQYHTNVPEYAFRLIGDRTIGRMVRGYTAWFYNQMAEVLAPTWATREVIARNGIDAEKVVIVQRGVDAETFHPRHADPEFWARHGLTGSNTLAYIGRVSVEKNVPFLVQLFRTLVDHDHAPPGLGEGALPLELAVVGDGPYLEQMKAELQGYPVAFTGYLEGQELAAAYASSDLLLFPSTTDTFGNVVLESLASGTPALVTDLGGPSEIVHHKETGLILPAGDMKRWADAVLALLRDGPRRARMAQNARDYAEDCTFEKARAATWEWYVGHIDRFRRSLRSDLR
jgi:glycosyltransferase involved in cell wall biosynthesis/predicted metal-dependent phosphoesterase TrpH